MRNEAPHHPLLERLTEELRAGLPRPRRVDAGQLVIQEADDPRFFFLLEGSVEISYTAAEGGQITPKIFSAPAVFGEVECVTQSPMHELVRTVTECRLISIDRASFVDLTERSPAFTRSLLWDVARRFEICILNERLLGLGRANARLVSFLLSSAAAHGVRRGDHVVIEREHTQESLAEAVGLNRRSVTRALDLLKRENIIRKEGRYFVLLDMAELERLAGDDPVMLHYRSSD